ncbi:MAG: DUF4126 domain-containing protein [Geodermatophilaceae bacterium]|nr:DUF4126 domain-containing protein [Geodermatophilaceae bacterium]MDQ3474910.1 DUF4126 domain-containing protein [Actinomycetota bacterium]
MDPVTGTLGGILAAFGLSGAAGLNAWLPLLAVGLGDRVGWIDLDSPYDALSSVPGLIVVGLLLVLDFIGDKVPALDSVLHAIGLAIAPASGAVLFAAQTDLTSDLNPAVGALLGALTAGSLQAGRAAVRPFVTASTAGVGNPVVSTAEDGASLAITVLAFVLPVLAFLLVVVALGLIVWLVLRARRWARSRRRQPG